MQKARQMTLKCTKSSHYNILQQCMCIKVKFCNSVSGDLHKQLQHVEMTALTRAPSLPCAPTVQKDKRVQQACSSSHRNPARAQHAQGTTTTAVLRMLRAKYKK